MDIGLYKMKHSFGRLIKALIPLCRNVDPNVLSLSILPLGALTAVAFTFSAENPWLLLLAVVLIFLRMVVATLDGLVALAYEKSSAMGEMINRIAPELADMMLLAGLLESKPAYAGLMVPVLLTAWATSFFGLIGLVAKRPIQSVGPCGQTDRLAALMLFSLLAFFSTHFGWGIDFILLFLWWTIIGGAMTIVLRCYRNARG